VFRLVVTAPVIFTVVEEPEAILMESRPVADHFAESLPPAGTVVRADYQTGPRSIWTPEQLVIPMHHG
jgi:hypothetical protein